MPKQHDAFNATHAFQVGGAVAGGILLGGAVGAIVPASGSALTVAGAGATVAGAGAAGATGVAGATGLAVIASPVLIPCAVVGGLAGLGLAVYRLMQE